MPQGTVSRYNDSSGAGFIKTATHSYAVRADDMDTKCRFEGANVDFDVEHDDPHDRAVNVTLREGTRHDPKQRRFGDTR